METIMGYALQFWQFTLVIVLIIIGAIWKLLDKEVEVNLTFSSEGMPSMKPIPIPTKGKGFWGGIKIWLFVSRKWEIVKDFHYNVEGIDLVIPKGFVFDGASVPKFMHTWLSPMGILLSQRILIDSSTICLMHFRSLSRLLRFLILSFAISDANLVKPVKKSIK